MQETIVGMAGATRIFGDSWGRRQCSPNRRAKPEWLLRLPGNVLKIDSTSANASAPRPRDGKQEIILVYVSFFRMLGVVPFSLPLSLKFRISKCGIYYYIQLKISIELALAIIALLE